MKAPSRLATAFHEAAAWRPGLKVHSALIEVARYSPTLNEMLRLGIPITRQAWIDINYMSHPPEPWTAMHEAEVPEPLRDFSKVERDD